MPQSVAKLLSGQNGHHLFRLIWMSYAKTIFHFQWSFFVRVSKRQSFSIVYIMAWHRTGDQPLIESVMKKCTYLSLYFIVLANFVLKKSLYTRRKSFMVWRGSVRPPVNIGFSTGVTTGRINFNFTDIIHLVCPVHDTATGHWSSSNMSILTQLLIFSFWSFARPFVRLEPSNFVQLEHLTH